MITADVSCRRQLPSGILVPIYPESAYMRDYFPRYYALNVYGGITIVDPWRDLRYYAVPAFDEIRLRCEEMDLLTCHCWPVADCFDGRRRYIYKPFCQVHAIAAEIGRIYAYPLG